MDEYKDMLRELIVCPRMHQKAGDPWLHTEQPCWPSCGATWKCHCNCVAQRQYQAMTCLQRLLRTAALACR
jgi:hypothetical protein